jgi:hypothetical protein
MTTAIALKVMRRRSPPGGSRIKIGTLRRKQL